MKVCTMHQVLMVQSKIVLKHHRQLINNWVLLKAENCNINNGGWFEGQNGRRCVIIIFMVIVSQFIIPFYFDGKLGIPVDKRYKK